MSSDVASGATQPISNLSRRQPPVVLVYRIGQLGDALVTIPAIKAIRARHPDSIFVLLTDRQPSERGWVSSWDVLGAIGVFADVVYYEPANSIRAIVKVTYRLARTLRDHRPDIVYNLAPVRNRWQRIRDRAFFVGLVGSPEYRTPPPLSHRQIRNSSGILEPVEAEWRRLMRVTPTPVESANAALLVQVVDVLSALSELCVAGGKATGPKIAIGPGSKMRAKRWPLESFVAVIELLHVRLPDYEFLIFGDANEMDVGEQLVDRLGQFCINLAGRLSVQESAALLARCSLYIGNDTGTMHLAAAVGCRCVAIFSSRDSPGLWEPFGPGHRVLRTDPPCAGCMLETCTAHSLVCLTSISADEVTSAALNILRVLDSEIVAND